MTTTAQYVLEAVSRAAMAAFTGMTAGRQAFLGESGREGFFTWSTADHMTKVAADPLQGIYVAPASDTDGSSGAWVRQYDGPVIVTWFGAVADGASDCSAAITAMLAVMKANTSVPVAYEEFFAPGDTAYFPPGRYYVSQTISLKQQVRFLGETRGNGNGSATVLLFPPNVHGIIANRHNTNGETGIIDPATTSAEGSVFEGLKITTTAGGITSSTACGIYARARVRILNCMVARFARDGIAFVANEGGSLVGNVNNSVVRDTTTQFNGRHGLYIAGDNANACVIDNLNTILNGEYGFRDATGIGQTWLGGHSASNGQLGSGLFRTTSIVWYATKIYAVVPGQAAAAATTVPDTNSAVWLLREEGVPAPFSDIPQWVLNGATGNPATAYGFCEGGAGYIGDGRHVHLNAYTEGRQGPYFGDGLVAIGGSPGAGFIGDTLQFFMDDADGVAVLTKTVRLSGSDHGVEIGGPFGAVARFDPPTGRFLPVGKLGMRDGGNGTSYTLGAQDAERITRFTNSSTCAVTVPANSSLPYTIGTEIQISAQGSAGLTLNKQNGGINFVGKSGTTIPAGGLARLVKQGTDTWILAGDVV